MFRRWLIRGLALTILTLCAAAWAGSWFAQVWVEYYAPTHTWYLILECGSVESEDYAAVGDLWKGWYVERQEPDFARFRYGYSTMPYRFGGFAYQPRPNADGSRWTVVPLWFPTLLSTLLLFLVWRKTRPKYHGNGFPIEPPANE